jgi:zinc transport system substrate-binding protein
MKVSFSLFVGIASVLLASCGGANAPDDGKIRIVTSIYPLAYFAERVAGPYAEVIQLVPAGVEPHDYEPTPRDIAALQKADIIFLNGGSVDVALQKAAEASDRHSHQSLGYAVTNLPIDGLDSTNAESMRTIDPHVWLDPILVKTIVHDIARGLIQAEMYKHNDDSPHAKEFETNAAAFVAKLTALDEDYRKGLAACPAGNAALTSHDAFGYLSKRYTIPLLPISGMSPEEEPSPKRMAQLVRDASAQHVTTVFFETLASPKLAETLADELDIRTDVLNPIEGLTQEQIAAGDDYLSLMRQNLAKLRSALRCP